MLLALQRTACKASCKVRGHIIQQCLCLVMWCQSSSAVSCGACTILPYVRARRARHAAPFQHALLQWLLVIRFALHDLDPFVLLLQMIRNPNVMQKVPICEDDAQPGGISC